MIKYSPQNQLKLFKFENPFDDYLDKSNSWVKLASVFPWDKLVSTQKILVLIQAV